jgi:hypothetical protein
MAVQERGLPPEADAVDHARHADPSPAIRVSRVEHLDPPQAVFPSGQLDRPIERLESPDALVHNLIGRRAVPGAEQIAPSDLGPIDPQPLGEQVHLRLVREDDLRAAEPTERAVRHRVRRDRLRVDLDVRNPVRPGGRA